MHQHNRAGSEAPITPFPRPRGPPSAALGQKTTLRLAWDALFTVDRAATMIADGGGHSLLARC